MKAHSRRLAYCSMLTALSVVLMLVLGITGIGTYAAPMLTALILAVVRQSYGTRTALTMWLAVGLLALLLVPDRELALFHLTVYGWYPILRPWLVKLPGVLSYAARYLLFNGSMVATYSGLMALLGMKEEGVFGLNIVNVLFFLMMNVIFWMQDTLLLPRVEETNFRLPK